VGYAYHPSDGRQLQNRKITVQVNLGKKQDPISEIISIKRAEGVGQEVEHLPSKSKEFKVQYHKTIKIKNLRPSKGEV
jgi:hypothetical protein